MFRALSESTNHAVACSVHLKIYPSPANLSESRQVLRVLQRFGEVTLFKSLRYEDRRPMPGTIIAIYRESQSAEKLLQASPVRFSLQSTRTVQDAEPSNVNIGVANDVYSIIDSEAYTNNSAVPSAPTSSWGALAQTQSKSESPFADYSEFAGVSNRPRSDENQNPLGRLFQITADRSKSNHYDYIERQPHYNSFEPVQGMVQEALTKVVPFKGLSDPGLRAKSSSVPIRLVVKSRRVTQRKSLRELWKQGAKESLSNSPETGQR